MTQTSTRQPNHRLRRERQLRGWSQQKLAEMIGTAMGQVSRWECGEGSPSPYYRERLCTIFDKDALQLGLLPEQGPEIPPSAHATMHPSAGTASNTLIIQISAIRFSAKKKGPTCWRMSDLSVSLFTPSFR